MADPRLHDRATLPIQSPLSPISSALESVTPKKKEEDFSALCPVFQSGSTVYLWISRLRSRTICNVIGFICIVCLSSVDLSNAEVLRNRIKHINSQQNKFQSKFRHNS
jgi:hypothetical protein